MPGLQDWNPKTEHLIRGLKPGQFLSGKQCFVAAGPPFLSMFTGDGISAQAAQTASSFTPGGDVVYPIALLQTWALAQNKALSRLFELGSDRSYFVTGHTVGQLTLSSVLYHGPNLLKMLYAWFHQDQTGQSPFTIQGLLDAGELDLEPMYPWTEGEAQSPGIPASYGGLPTIQIAPGYQDKFFNLASDMFDLPHGMLFLLRDTQGNNLACFYLEQCHSPNYQLALDAQGLMMQESGTIHFERMVPIPLNSVALLNGIVAPDATS